MQGKGLGGQPQTWHSQLGVAGDEAGGLVAGTRTQGAGTASTELLQDFK